MTDDPTRPCTAFDGSRLLARGPLGTVALAVKAAGDRPGPLLVFDDATGKVIDLDLRGSEAAVLARLGPLPALPDEAAAPRGRGRPRLGVVAREVTLLPQHWDWLGRQPGGASVALRKLVEAARKSGAARERKRRAQEAAYAFLAATCGDRPGFEDALRALFADDRARFEARIARWPRDLRAHALRLAFGDN